MNILRRAIVIISIALTVISGYLVGGRRVEPGLSMPLPRPMITGTLFVFETRIVTPEPSQISTPYPPPLIATPYPLPR